MGYMFVKFFEIFTFVFVERWEVDFGLLRDYKDEVVCLLFFVTASGMSIGFFFLCCFWGCVIVDRSQVSLSLLVDGDEKFICQPISVLFTSMDHCLMGALFLVLLIKCSD